MGQNRLNALFSTVHRNELLKEIDVESTIKDFASRKAQKIF